MLVRPWLPTRPALYYRASTESQEEMQTIRTQQQFNRRHLELLGFDPRMVPEYCDDGVTGMSSILGRPDGKRLIADAKRGIFDTVYVYAVDRLGREAFFVLEAERELRLAGVKLQSCTQAFDPSEVTGAFLLALLAGQAQMDRTQLVNRLHSGQNRCAGEGYWIGGKVPFGYLLQRDGRRQRLGLCALPFPGCEEWTPVRVVEWIFERCYQDRATCVTIARDLNAMAVPTYWIPGSTYADQPQRSEWLPCRVRAILACETYTGVHTFGKAVCRTRRAEREPIRRECPQIIPPEQFLACQRILTDNRNLSVRPRSRPYLLRGLIKCGHCGRNYVGTGRFHGEKGQYVYQCAGRQRYSPVTGYCRPSHWLPADRLEATVKAAIRYSIEHPLEMIAELQQQHAGEQDRASEHLAGIATLEKQQGALNGQEQEYIRMRAAGLIRTDSQLRELLDETDRRRASLQQQILALHEKLAACRQADAAIQTAAALLAELETAALDDYTDADWRRMAELWVVQIIAHSTGERKQKQARAEVQMRVPVDGVRATELCTYWRRFNYGTKLAA